MERIGPSSWAYACQGSTVVHLIVEWELELDEVSGKAMVGKVGEEDSLWASDMFSTHLFKDAGGRTVLGTEFDTIGVWHDISRRNSLHTVTCVPEGLTHSLMVTFGLTLPIFMQSCISSFRQGQALVRTGKRKGATIVRTRARGYLKRSSPIL